VPPGAERKVSLKFSQLLRKNNTLTDLFIPLSTAKYTSQPVEKLAINVAVETTAELKNVYSPTHAVNVQRPDNKHAVVKFEATNTVPTTDFRLFCDTADGPLGASLLSYRPNTSEDGFFLLLASPEVKSASDERPAKTVIFVVDRSGSMSGKKIEQAKEALKFVLNNLRQGDTFNVVAYDSTVEAFKPELQKYDDETRKAALGFVDGLYAGGSTNIDGALTSALGMITDTSRPNYVLFLTDGLPTAGETNEAKIVANTKQNNKHRVRMINFGVGYDLNSRLLDRLSRENFGQSEFVRPDENIEAHVSRLYGKMSSPVMTGLEVKVDVDAGGDGAPTNRIYPKQAYDLFAGEQLVMVGRYKKTGGAKITITGKVGSADRKFDFPGTLIEKSMDQSYAFVEKLWAMRRIGEIIDELDLKGKNDELITELVSLSTKHGILTQYTSFLADENAPAQQLADLHGNTQRARFYLDRLEVTDGLQGVAQRDDKRSLQLAERAPAAPSAAFGGGTLPAGSAPADWAGYQRVGRPTDGEPAAVTALPRGPRMSTAKPRQTRKWQPKACKSPATRRSTSAARPGSPRAPRSSTRPRTPPRSSGSNGSATTTSPSSARTRPTKTPSWPPSRRARNCSWSSADRRIASNSESRLAGSKFSCRRYPVRRHIRPLVGSKARYPALAASATYLLSSLASRCPPG
jgi:Ca-activated chloride channel family protein